MKRVNVNFDEVIDGLVCVSTADVGEARAGETVDIHDDEYQQEAVIFEVEKGVWRAKPISELVHTYQSMIKIINESPLWLKSYEQVINPKGNLLVLERALLCLAGRPVACIDPVRILFDAPALLRARDAKPIAYT